MGLKEQLEKLYSDKNVERDVYGNRPATSREIEEAIGIRPMEFLDRLGQNLPTEQDLINKEEGLRRRRHPRKPH
jgi:hypothetical protein